MIFIILLLLLPLLLIYDHNHHYITLTKHTIIAYSLSRKWRHCLQQGNTVNPVSININKHKITLICPFPAPSTRPKKAPS